MNPMHQLTRRPVKAAFGALLLALAGVILALSGGQFWAAARTRARVEATYTTVAVVTGGDEQAGDSDPSLASASAAWEAARFLEQPEQQNWSIIRSRPRVGLVSGYSPGLKPAISLYTGHSSSDAPYEYSIVEIRADAVTQSNNDWFGESGSANWLLEGQVLGVYGLNDAFRDPSGQRASMLLHQEYDDPAELLHPEAGKRYLLLSYSYEDSEWSLRRNVADWVFMETNVKLDPWSLDISGNLIRYDQRKNQSEHWYHTAGDAAEEPVEFAPEELIYRDPTTGAEVYTGLDMEAFGRFSFSAARSRDREEGTVADPEQPQGWSTKTVDYRVYDLPSIQELPEGVTAQEVIDNTSSWRTAMESIQVNNHSVPVLAVDFVEGMLEFASERAQVTQGRSISQEEYRDGAAVCLISETLARENGLNVGDVLPLSLYENEKDLPPTLRNLVGDSDPTASYYLPQRGFQQETEYTIVGLYRQSNEWSQGVASFTPNTVLVPRKSVTCAVETGETGLGVSSGCLWETMVLQNGTIDQMEARLAENGLGGTVTYYDQGYSDIVESLDGYTRVSRTVLLVGLALWAVVLAAYCILLPMQEGKTALRMWTLGAKRRDIAGQIWTPSALMAAAGTVIALAVSIPGMSWATDKIQALTGSDLTLTVSTGQTVALCAGALAIALAVIALVSVSTAQRGIRKAG